MIDIGFLPAKGGAGRRAIEARVVNLTPGLDGERALGPPGGGSPGLASSMLRQCPKCGEAALIRIEGCDQCTSCAYSKCG